MFDEKNFLYESFKLYYEHAEKAQANGNYALAKKNLLQAAEALYKMAKTDTADLKASRIKRADSLVAMAKKMDTGACASKGSSSSGVSGSKSADSDDDTKEWQSAEIPSIGFKDVAGLDDVKESITMLMINPVKYPEKYAAYNKKTGGGVLLYGPPGTGKTMIAKAIAHEVGAVFYAVKGSDIVSKWVGESERNINSLFETARKQKLAIIFIDEMDSLFGQRGNDTHNDKRVNEFLQQIDGFAGKCPNLLILGATNRPWDVDGAAVRSGRFSQKIYVPLPDFKAREYLFKLYLKKTPVAPDVSFKELAALTEDYSGADIAEVCDRAKEGPLNNYIKTDLLTEVTKGDLAKALREVVPMVDRKEIEKFEAYAGIKRTKPPIKGASETSGISAKEPEEKPDDKNLSGEIIPEQKDEAKEIKVVYNKEIKLFPDVKPVFEFYVEGDYEKLYITVRGKSYVCEKQLMNWRSEPLDIKEGGTENVTIFGDKPVAEVLVTFVKGMVEDDMDI